MVEHIPFHRIQGAAAAAGHAPRRQAGWSSRCCPLVDGDRKARSSESDGSLSGGSPKVAVETVILALAVRSVESQYKSSKADCHCLMQHWLTVLLRAAAIGVSRDITSSVKASACPSNRLL